jgi:hypothetical protein
MALSRAGDATKNLSVRDQIIVSVGAMLVLSLFLTFGSYMAGLQTRQTAHTLATEGVAVNGEITNKVERFGGIVNGPKYTWWLDVAYTTRAGETVTKTIGVDESVYDRTSIGPIRVTYIKSEPKVFFIPGVFDSMNHSDADAGVVDDMTYYGVMVSIALGFILAALLITRGGGGAQTPPQPVKLPSGQPPRETLRGQPGQFGRRV